MTAKEMQKGDGSGYFLFTRKKKNLNTKISRNKIKRRDSDGIIRIYTLKALRIEVFKKNKQTNENTGSRLLSWH